MSAEESALLDAIVAVSARTESRFSSHAVKVGGGWAAVFSFDGYDTVVGVCGFGSEQQADSRRRDLAYMARAKARTAKSANGRRKNA